MRETSRIKYSSLRLVLALCLLGPALVQAQLRLDLAQALALAKEHNPGVAMLAAQWQAAQHSVSQSDALPDPQLSLGLANLPEFQLSLDKDPMSQWQLGYSQALPFPGKRGLQRRQAGFQLEAVAQSQLNYELWLEQQVAHQWWELVYIEQLLRINQEEQGLFQRLRETSQTLYSVGRGQQQDVLMAQLKLSHLQEQALRLQGQQQSVRAQLNVLINQPIDQNIGVVNRDDVVLPQAPLLKDLYQQIQQHPLLTGQQAQINALRSQRDLAERDAYPDFKVSAMYGLRDGREDLLSVQVAMSLPIFADSKQHRLKDERGAQLLAARHQRQQLLNQQQSAVISAHGEYQAARQQVEVFRQEILPQAQQSVDAMLAGYQVNKVDFSALTQAQSRWIEHRSHYWRTYTQAWQSWARLHAALGQSVKEFQHD